MKCDRCGARWSEERSCGKAIHLSLPLLPRAGDNGTSIALSRHWQASILSDTFSAEALGEDQTRAAVEAIGWELDEPEEAESGIWLVAIPQILADAIFETGLEIVVPGTAMQITIDVP